MIPVPKRPAGFRFWLLHRTLDGRRRIWWVLPVLIAWANLHGGFIFGLGMVCLWALCITLDDWRRTRRNPLAQDSPLWACAAACIAAAAISPFGLENLTHPLVIASSKAWRAVPEWRPLLQSPFPAPWGFFAVLGLTATLSVLRLLALAIVRLRGQGRGRARSTPSPSAASASQPAQSGAALGAIAFDAILAVLVVLMAFKSQRFAPLVVLVLAAPLASSLAWCLPRLGRLAMPAMASCVVAGLAVLGWQHFNFYRPANPLRVSSTFFDRMHLLAEQYPVRAARFLALNNLTSNAVCEWEWEGYLHWYCPDLKLLIGGRAQQVYTEAHLAAFNRLYDAKVGPTWLQEHDVRLAVLFFGELGRVMMSELLATGRWIVIFADGQSIVLVDRQLDPDLAQRAVDGTLKYPSDAIRLLSRAACLSTADPNVDRREILNAASQANALWPTAQGYALVVRNVTRTVALRPAVTVYLEQESSHLRQLAGAPVNYQAILLCRREIQAGLAALYRDAGREDAALAAQAEADDLDRRLDALQAVWN